MAVVRKGILAPSSSPVRTMLPRLTVDETGLVTLVEEYRCDVADLSANLPGIGSAHPTFTNLFLRANDVFFLRADLAGWRATYRGPQSTSPLPANRWTVDVSAGLENIAAHPDFASLLTAAGEGAVEDENGIFVGFNEDDESTGKQLAGVEQFFKPSVTVTKTSWTSTTPTGGQSVGTINTPSGTGSGIASSQTSGSQNWLKIGFQAEQFDSFWQVRETWLRSDDRGWSALIYS